MTEAEVVEATEEPKEKVNYDEVTKFILENVNQEKTSDPTEEVHQINKLPYTKFMKTQGISEETLKKFSDSHNLFMNGTISAAKDLMVKAPDDVEKVTIRTRMMTGRMDTTVRKESNTNNPKTGERGVRYGAVQVTQRSRTKFDTDLLREVEEAVRKKALQE